MTHGLFVSTKRMTGFTQIHLPLVSDYLRVLSTQQDSLVSISREYKVHDRSYSRVVLTHRQLLMSRVLLVSREPNM